MASITGIKLPFSFTDTCDINMEEDENLIQGNMIIACLTYAILFSEMGTTVLLSVFDPNDRPTKAVLAEQVRRAINEGVDNVYISRSVAFNSDEHKLEIRVPFFFERKALESLALLKIPRSII